MESVRKGSEVPFIEITRVTQDQLRAYADASGDTNPIHLDEAVARKVGLPGVIAHGMFTAGLLAERAARFVAETPDLNGGRGWTAKKFNARFKSMTFLGDVISIGGTVKESTPTELTLDLKARKQDGTVTTTGYVIFNRKP